MQPKPVNRHSSAAHRLRRHVGVICQRWSFFVSFARSLTGLIGRVQGFIGEAMQGISKRGEHTGLYLPGLFPRSFGLDGHRRGSRRVRRLLGGLPGGQRYLILAGIAAAAAAVVAAAGIAAAVVVVAVSIAAAVVEVVAAVEVAVAVEIAAVEVADTVELAGSVAGAAASVVAVG